LALGKICSLPSPVPPNQVCLGPGKSCHLVCASRVGDFPNRPQTL